MTLKALLDVLHESLETSTADEIKAACYLIVYAQSMTSADRDALKAAYHIGPLYDGDVPSKVGRDKLVIDGLMVKVVVKGEEGFNACTYKGARVARLLEHFKCQCVVNEINGIARAEAD